MRKYLLWVLLFTVATSAKPAFAATLQEEYENYQRQNHRSQICQEADPRYSYIFGAYFPIRDAEDPKYQYSQLSVTLNAERKFESFYTVFHAEDGSHLTLESLQRTYEVELPELWTRDLFGDFILGGFGIGSARIPSNKLSLNRRMTGLSEPKVLAGFQRLKNYLQPVLSSEELNAFCQN